MRVSARFFFPILFTTTGLAWGPTGHEWVTHRAVDSLAGRFEVLQGRHRARLVGRAMGADYRNDGDPEESSRHFVDVERYDRELFSRREMDVEGLVLQFGLDETWKNGTGPWSAEQTFTTMSPIFTNPCTPPRILTDNSQASRTSMLDSKRDYSTGTCHELPLTGWNRWILGPVLPVLLEVVLESHQEVDTVLGADDRIVSGLALDRQAYRRRGERRSYPDRYFERMSEELGGFLAERLNQAAHRVASLWRMVWEQAGEPEF